MKSIGETHAIDLVHRLKSKYAEMVRRDFEKRAKDCGACETKGACCQDAHFVNVRITRLEARSVRRVLAAIDPELQAELEERIEDAVDRHHLTSGGDITQTFACPLFERATGCIIHDRGKPIPCITHACYDRRDDLPPDGLSEEAQQKIAVLDRMTYRRTSAPLPLPLALLKAR